MAADYSGKMGIQPMREGLEPREASGFSRMERKRNGGKPGGKLCRAPEKKTFILSFSFICVNDYAFLKK